MKILVFVVGRRAPACAAHRRECRVNQLRLARSSLTPRARPRSLTRDSRRPGLPGLPGDTYPYTDNIPEDLFGTGATCVVTT